MVEQSGFVALIGAPNAGKSTLLNQLVGQKLSIVSHKVQTTRTQLRGVVMVGDAQVIFVDTPGIFQPKRRLDRAMVQSAWSGAGDADVIALLIDAAKGIAPDVKDIIDELKKREQTVVLLLNKIDLVAREVLLPLTETLNDMGIFSDIFMISATKGEGIEDLKTFLASKMPEGPYLYPPDQLTDLPSRLLAAEITREKLFHHLHQELPYHITVETELYEERKDGSVKLEQTIYVTRKGHKGIVLGKGGETIKRIGKQAREDIGQLLGCKVHLFLFVKVREKWEDDPDRYTLWGLDPQAKG